MIGALLGLEDVGDRVGSFVGDFVTGLSVGDSLVGEYVGIKLGSFVGALLGLEDVGDRVGSFVGRGVMGLSVGDSYCDSASSSAAAVSGRTSNRALSRTSSGRGLLSSREGPRTDFLWGTSSSAVFN